nr:hypothetical protein [Tanacetum cinerariifolium]
MLRNSRLNVEIMLKIYDDDFENIEYVEASLSDPEIVSVEEENVVQREEEEVDLEDISQIQDVVLREKLLSITRLISNIKSLNDNSTPDRVLNSFESDNSLLDNFSPEFETFCDHSEETRSENASNSNQEKEGPPHDSNIRKRIREECYVEVSKEKKQIAPILSTKGTEQLFSMGYEHSNTTPETELDEIVKSGVEELVPILSENKVTLKDKKECDVPIFENSLICDDHSEIFFDSKNDDDISVYDDFEDIKYVEVSLSDPKIVSVEEENVVYKTEENTNIPDDLSSDPLLKEADLFLASDNLIPPGIENVANDSEGDIHFLEELLIDDSTLSHESSDSNFEDNLSVPLPPLEPPDEEFDFRDEISVVIDKLEGIDVKVEFENDNYYFFDKVFSFLSAESEDTIFDPCISV